MDLFPTDTSFAFGKTGLQTYYHYYLSAATEKEREGHLLHIKDNGVNLGCFGCKLAADRECAGNIRSVAIVFCTCIHQNKICGPFHRCIVLVVMKCGCVLAASHDRQVGLEECASTRRFYSIFALSVSCCGMLQVPYHRETGHAGRIRSYWAERFASAIIIITSVSRLYR